MKKNTREVLLNGAGGGCSFCLLVLGISWPRCSCPLAAMACSGRLRAAESRVKRRRLQKNPMTASEAEQDAADRHLLTLLRRQRRTALGVNPQAAAGGARGRAAAGGLAGIRPPARAPPIFLGPASKDRGFARLLDWAGFDVLSMRVPTCHGLRVYAWQEDEGSQQEAWPCAGG